MRVPATRETEAPVASTFRGCSVAISWAARLAALVACIASPFLALAADEKAEDAYQPVWKGVAELVRRREYGTALALLESKAEDPALQSFGKRIEADKAAVGGLQKLEKIVYEQAAKLGEGQPFGVSGVTYTVQGYVKDPQGDALSLRSRATDQESRKRIADLPTDVWLSLAGTRLASIEQPALVQGVFLGFDRSVDAKAARKHFNDAAKTGVDVVPWLARLEGVEADRKAADAAKPDDPLLGAWRITMGKDGVFAFNTEVLKNGTTTVTVPASTLAEMRKRKQPLPKPNPGKGTWTRDEDGAYRITGPNGGTLQVTLDGDRLTGRNAAGDPVKGVRQAAK